MYFVGFIAFLAFIYYKYSKLIKIIFHIFRQSEGDRIDALKILHEESPRYLRVQVCHLKYFCVYDPAIYSKIFNSHAACQRPFRNCFQLDGLLASEYDCWRMARKNLNVAFNLNVLKGFIPIFKLYCEKLVEEMQQHLDGNEFDVYTPLAKLTACSVAATTLNVHGVEESAYDKLIVSIGEILEKIFKRILNPILQLDFIYRLTQDYREEQVARQYTFDYGDKLIAAARKRIQDEKLKAVNKDKVEYIIDQLIRESDTFSDKEIREHLLVFLITASESSTRFLAITLIFLGIHQDVQQRLHDEIAEFIEDETDIDYEKLSSLKYLEMILKETLRLFTPLPITVREAIDKIDVGLDEPIAKGTKIIFFNSVIQRRSDLWENANQFNPENFSHEKMSKRDSYAFVPFGAGARMCIGNRYAMIFAKIAIIKFIKTYKVKTNLQESDLKMKISLTAQLIVDHMISIEKR